MLREDAPRAQTARERRQLADLDEDLRSIPLRGAPLPLRLRNFRPDAEGYLASLGGPLPYMVRLREIEAMTAAHEQALAAAYDRVAAEVPADAFAEAWRDEVARWGFDEVNDLIARHNRWYPVEARLRMDPRRARLRARQRARLPPAAARRGVGARAVPGGQAGRRRATPRVAASSVSPQSAPQSR